MPEPLNDSLGLNSTGDKEQQVVTGVPPPGQSATAGNGEKTGLPPALLVGGGSDATPASQSATEGNGAQTGHSPADEDDGSGSGIVAPTAPTVPEAAPASNLWDDAPPSRPPTPQGSPQPRLHANVRGRLGLGPISPQVVGPRLSPIRKGRDSNRPTEDIENRPSSCQTSKEPYQHAVISGGGG